LVCTSK
jgi:hypothetical protein